MNREVIRGKAGLASLTSERSIVSTTTLTVRLSPEIEDRLDRLAVRTRRDRSTIAGAAIANYVERELAIVEGINEAVEDVRAGRIVPHDQVMDEVRALIAEAESR